jgi:phosphate-selective porin OprO/OprP
VTDFGRAAGRGVIVVALCALGVAFARGSEEAGPTPSAPEQPEQQGPGPSAPAGRTTPDGFWIALGNARLRPTGLVQADGRFFLGAGAGKSTDTFLLRRVRFSVEGEIGKYFAFYVNPDLAGGNLSIMDAYVELRGSAALRVRVGKMKTPFGLERLQSGRDLLFADRGLPTELVPNRDVGAMLHGSVAGEVLQYALALTNGVVDGGSADTDSNDSKDLAARLFVQPFKRRPACAVNGLGLGLALSRGRQAGALPSYRTTFQRSFFAYRDGAVADGDRLRVAPQAYWYAGPLGLAGEFVRSSQEVSLGDVRARLGHSAWNAALSLVLTGEKASYGQVRPRHPFDPQAHAWGALQLAARCGALDVDRAAFVRGLADEGHAARRVRSLGVSLVWYLNDYVKQLVSFERTLFRGGAPGGADRPADNVLHFRSQVAF